MNEGNTLARFATPTNLMAGRSFLGRIRVTQINGNLVEVSGVDLYDSTSLDISAPFMTVGVGENYGGATDSAADFRSGATADGLFCVVHVGPNGDISTTFNGIHFAWYRFFETQPPQWRLVANGGVSNVIVCPEGNNVCQPFAFPFGWKICLDEGEFAFQYPLKPGQPAFVSSVGTAGLPEGWRLEYQACAPDDPNNDATPGIRSPWNFLAANCCSTSPGGDDDDGTGDGDDDEEDGGGGGGDDDQSRCESLGFLCALVVRECFSDVDGVPFNKWCLIDDRMGCWIHSGRRCFCNTRVDINGDPIPNPNTLPPGTVIITGCGAPGAIPPCSELPEDEADQPLYHCPPP